MGITSCSKIWYNESKNNDNIISLAEKTDNFKKYLCVKPISSQLSSCDEECMCNSLKEKYDNLDFLLETSMISFELIYNWVEKTNWITFLSNNKSKEYLSNTGITFKICEEWYLSKNEEDQRSIVKKICKILSDENVAHDINGYAKAPPSFRVWAGGTIEPKNIELMLPWLEWAFKKVKATHA